MRLELLNQKNLGLKYEYVFPVGQLLDGKKYFYFRNQLAARKTNSFLRLILQFLIHGLYYSLSRNITK